MNKLFASSTKYFAIIDAPTMVRKRFRWRALSQIGESNIRGALEHFKISNDLICAEFCAKTRYLNN